MPRFFLSVKDSFQPTLPDILTQHDIQKEKQKIIINIFARMSLKCDKRPKIKLWLSSIKHQNTSF